MIRVALDMFPANVYTPNGGRHDPSRIVIADDEAKVYIASGAGIVCVFTAPVLSIEGNRMAGYSIQTPTGELKAISAGGCGCGSPLRSFDPFAGATATVMAGLG